MFDRQVSISMTARLVSFNRKSAAAVLWGRKLQCSLLHLNKYIKKEREEELGFHSNWHLSNGGDELEGIRLENDIFASWRVRIDPVSYPITARAVVQAFAIQHKSASQTTTGCRTSPQTSQEVDLMNTCPPTPLLYHLSIHFSCLPQRRNAATPRSLGIRKPRYDWQHAILRNLSVIFNYTTYLSFIVTGKWSILPPDLIPYPSSTLWGLFFSCFMPDLVFIIIACEESILSFFWRLNMEALLRFHCNFYSYVYCLVPMDAFVF